MIRIEITKVSGRYSGLRITGHSPLSHGKPGENLVCAAVSILSQTLELCLYNSNQLSNHKKEKGFQEFLIMNPNSKSDIQFEFFKTGIGALMKESSEIIVLEEKGEIDGT